MRISALAALAALSTLAAAPALAQAPAAPAPAAAGKLSVQTTPIGEIIKIPAGKAALEKTLPEIPPYYDQVGAMTLAQLMPMSQGAIDEAKLKTIQADFDAIK